MGNIKILIIYILLLVILNINLSNSFNIKYEIKKLLKLYNDDMFIKHPHKVDPIPTKKTEDIIREAGYVAERHQVRTKDNYWLTVHRIPRGKHQQSDVNRPVVVLLHGVVCSSGMFVLNGPENSLGYLLAEEGYDVWMPNSRGNLYSRSHEFLDPIKDAPRFWNFSFNEMGYYDMPATVDYILESTGQTQIYLIGYSMGTTVSYVFLSTRSEYNSKVKAVFSIAPVAYLDHVKSPLFKLFYHFQPFIENYLLDHDKYEILPQNYYTEFIHVNFCNGTKFYPVCKLLVELFAGFDHGEIDKVRLDKLLDQSPAGVSLKTFQHYGQLIRAKKFQKFDYGWGGNYLEYNSIKAPEYDFSKIIVPTILFYAKNDVLAVKQDVDKLFNKLPHIVGKIIIKEEKFNHLDFFFGKNAKSLVFNPLIDILNRYKNGIE